MNALIHALDDESAVLEWLKRVLSDYDLKVFKDAGEFIEAFSAEVDLIITDMRVPGYDIYSTLANFKQINRGVYVIVISAYFDVSICERLFELDVDRIIEKGSSPDWMFKIERYIGELFPRIHKRAEISQ